MKSHILLAGLLIMAGLAFASYFFVRVTYPDGGETVDGTIEVTAHFSWDIADGPNGTGPTMVAFYYTRSDGEPVYIDSYDIDFLEECPNPRSCDGEALVDWDTTEEEDGGDYKILAKLTTGRCLYIPNPEGDMKIMCLGWVHAEDTSDDFFTVREDGRAGQ